MNTTTAAPTKLTLSYSVAGQGKITHTVSTIEEAASIFCNHRMGQRPDGSYSFNDFGSSELKGAVSVLDGKKVVATIAYNGRVALA